MNKSNNIADEKVFPQVMVDKNTEKINVQAMSEFSELTVKPAVQNRPVKIIKMEEETNGVVFELETEGRTDAVCYTHETSMFYTEEAEKRLTRFFCT